MRGASGGLLPSLSQHCLKDASALQRSPEKNFLGKHVRREHGKAPPREDGKIL